MTLFGRIPPIARQANFTTDRQPIVSSASILFEQIARKAPLKRTYVSMNTKSDMEIVVIIQIEPILRVAVNRMASYPQL
ncbi:hypothetical protein TVD_05130 [Thioalkalivibrio versutus]|uniref:Uncharacterized protein n=1 Tax=Thioalkalivibrio versutus TaxID=106634 RepID=A0A0G3G0P8_9GAMM|nr:hypothetical protein TVD_05130 [Thioalkalivibrio versutus]